MLRHDLCFQTAVGREVPLASSSTLSRFENMADRASIVKFNQQLVEHFIRRHDKAPTEIILDFDPTDHRLYGHQEARHYHGYYREHCFLPLHVFCGDDLLVSLLRPSHIDASKYSGAVLRLLLKRLRQAWPTTIILFRGDCAFARKRLLHWMDNNDVDYVIGIACNSRLKSHAKGLLEQAEKAFSNSGEKQRLFDEFTYAAGTWKTSRRVVVKIERNTVGINQRFVVTNRQGGAAQMIYDDQYCLRGDMENSIKQTKLDLYADRNSCHAFMANQLRIMLSAVAYLLISELRRSHLTGTPLSKAYCQTIRLKLFKIGVIILKNSRRIQFLLSSHHPYRKAFEIAAATLIPT